MEHYEEYISCAVCGKKYKQIHSKHVHKHGLTISEYKAKFPDHPINSKTSAARRSKSLLGKPRSLETRTKISESNKQSWIENPNQGRTGHALSEDSRNKLSEQLMGHKVSDETRKKIAVSGLGREPWNKGLTKDEDERLASVSAKIKKWNLEFMTPEKKQKISQTLKKKYAAGMKIPHAKGHYREDLGKYFRSTWEANFARIQNYEQIKWTYESDKFKLMDDNGDIVAVYTPDFFTDDIIEVKGHADAEDDWTCNCKRCDRDKLKIKLFFEQHPQAASRFKLIGRKEYKELAIKYASIIPWWEVTSRG